MRPAPPADAHDPPASRRRGSIAALRRATRAIDLLNEWVGKALAYLILPIFVLLMIEVFARYLFNAPAVWRSELTQMLFGVYVILSGGYLLAEKGHVNVDILTSRATPRTRAILDVCTSALFFVFAGTLFYFGFAMAWDSLSIRETSQSAWDPPIYPMKLMIPAGAGLLLLQGLAKLLRDVLFVFTGEDVLPSHLHQKETL
jgi:TRAP-type mannitol/chloroaromatic compound transport system permease small subunit